MERSLVLVKPDGVQRGLASEILGRFERRGLKLAALRVVQVSRELAEEHYAEHRGKPFYDGLVDYITSGPVLAAVIAGPAAEEGNPASGAIAMIRQTVGATRPWDAAPGSIRADFGLAVGRNLVHASANLEDAEREVSLWFQPVEILDYALDTDRWITE